MTVSVQAAVPSVAAMAGLSKSKDTVLAARFTQMDATVANPGSLFMAYAKSAAAPATWADLANPVINPISAEDQVSWQFTDSTHYAGSVQDNTARANAAWTVGNSVYVTFWSSATPASSDVPLQVSPAILVIA